MQPFWHFEGTNASVRELEYLSESGIGPARALHADTLLASHGRAYLGSAWAPGSARSASCNRAR